MHLIWQLPVPDIRGIIWPIIWLVLTRSIFLLTKPPTWVFSYFKNLSSPKYFKFNIDQILCHFIMLSWAWVFTFKQVPLWRERWKIGYFHKLKSVLFPSFSAKYCSPTLRCSIIQKSAFLKGKKIPFWFLDTSMLLNFSIPDYVILLYRDICVCFWKQEIQIKVCGD